VKNWKKRGSISEDIHKEEHDRRDNRDDKRPESDIITTKVLDKK
jgi:hypothetical protein